MYEAGDVVVYGSVGVCKIEAVGVPDLEAADNNRIYYTLAPVYKDGRIYAPVDTRTFMRPIISREEALALIRAMPAIDESVYESRNMGMLKEHYRDLLLSHDCVDLIHVIKSVYVKRRTLAENRKSLGQVETQYMRQAEEMLYDEFAVALGIPRSEVRGYIEDAVAKDERRSPGPLRDRMAFDH